MKLQINDSYHISDIAPSDKAAYLEHLQEKQIYDQTLAIPFPYTEADADWWINHNIEATANQSGRSVNWAVRRSDNDALIGGIGFLGLTIGEDHKAELGYWLAKPYWKNGIMTAAVKKAVEFGFKEFGLTRITADVFHFNIGSARVLEKAGFQCEGYLRSHHKKDGKIFDGKLYAILNSDLDDTVKIRPIKPDSTNEIELIAKRMRETLVEVLGEEEGGSMYTMGWLKQRVMFHLDPKQSTAQVFVAENNETQILGHTIVRIDKDDAGKSIGLFSTTFVAPEFRRQAVATSLLSHGEEWMRGQGMTEAATYTSDSNTKLINLYVDHGYKIIYNYPEKKMIKIAKALVQSAPGLRLEQTEGVI